MMEAHTGIDNGGRLKKRSVLLGYSFPSHARSPEMLYHLSVPYCLNRILTSKLD